jgi:arylsulfatase A-like enzyme
MGCLGPADGPNYNLPQPPSCPTGPNTNPNGDGQPALPLYNSTFRCGNESAPNCNSQIVQQPVNEVDLDSNYGDFLSTFIGQHAKGSGANPFFAYMAFSHTHVPLFFDPKFANSSVRNTLFADTTMEMDHTVNRIWQAVKAAGIEEDTLILATADNGPWAVKCDLAGSPGPYIGAWQHTDGGGGSSLKDTTWEGGQHVFGLAHWPGHIPAQLVTGATVSSLDFLPTILALAGVPLRSDRSYDGVDLAPLLFGNATSVRDFLFMSDTSNGMGNITSVRYKQYKAYTKTYAQPSCTEDPPKAIEHPDYLIFDLDTDPAESTPVRPPQAVLDAIWAAHHALLVDINTTFRSVTDYSEGPTMIGSAPCCNPANAVCRCEAN